MNDDILTTGFNDIDEKAEIFQKGALTIVAGRPSMGKTSFMLSVCQNIMDNNKILYFSLSESEESICSKLLRQISTVNVYGDVLNDEKACSKVSANEFQKILEAKTRLRNSNLSISGRYLCIEELKKQLDVIEKDTYDFIVVDGFQELLPYSSTVAYEVIKENNSIASYFKKIARDKNVSFVVTTNCSRKVDDRTGHRPCVTDFNDCEFENYANVIVFLLRRECYDPYDRPGQAEVILAKGPFCVGCINLTFSKEISLFNNFCAPPMIEMGECEFKPFNPC